MRECPECGKQAPEEARYCSLCRFDFGVVDGAADAEGVAARAEGRRAVFHFVMFLVAIIIGVVIAASKFMGS
jgi:uncharacterized membrane protein YvbJ